MSEDLKHAFEKLSAADKAVVTQTAHAIGIEKRNKGELTSENASAFEAKEREEIAADPKKVAKAEAHYPAMYQQEKGRENSNNVQIASNVRGDFGIPSHAAGNVITAEDFGKDSKSNAIAEVDHEFNKTPSISKQQMALNTKGDVRGH